MENIFRPEDLAGVVGSIVVAVDGSEHAGRAVRWAADQAALEHRRLTVFAAGQDAESVAERAVEAADVAHPELAVRVLTSRRDARAALVELSSAAHLLVLGSHGRGAVKSMLLGSVSTTVSAQADCPVVVCRPDDHHGGTGIVVGADGTPESRPVIDFAFRHAALHDLPLTVLHCFWDAAAAAAQYRRARGEPVDEPDLADLEAMLAESVAGFAETYPDVPVTLTLQHGLVDEALAPRTGPWDLVVVGRHPMTSRVRVLTGSIARSVVERSHSTVAVVPEKPRVSRTAR